MDNQEHLSMTSRAEYIKMARESCTRNLGTGSGKMKYHSVPKPKEVNSWNQDMPVKPVSLAEQGFIAPAVNLKMLLIRIIFALALFLAVFLIDKFDVKVKSVDSAYIQEMITTNKSIEDAQDFFVSLYQDFLKTTKTAKTEE